MHHFQNDYNAMCHPIVLEYLTAASLEHMEGYGNDEACSRAAAYICRMCGDDNLNVHFLTGGTQVNLTVIAAALRPYQAVVAAKSAHIAEHETGAIEATGHKILELEPNNGKITAEQILEVVKKHYSPGGPGPEHTPQPKLVYISFTTELGTIYSLSELQSIRQVCDQYSLYLYIDGARLGYGLCAEDSDVMLSDLSQLCDAFYIGGTKQGTMFGEAVVIKNPVLAADFRYMIKQRGGMLAKGWLIGLQFEALLKDDLYFTLSMRANRLADQIREVLIDKKCDLPVNSRTNQVFVTLPDSVLDALSEDFLFCEWYRVDENSRMIRFCTSWSTLQSDVDALCNRLNSLL